MDSTSKERKREDLYQKYQLLRDATNSTAMNKASIIVDASKYIEELKNKVEELSQESIGSTSTSQVSNAPNPLPLVTVETLANGYLINVLSERNCPGLLVSILEAFEELGLDVLDASVSCADTFQLEAVGQNQGSNIDSMDAQVVQNAVLQAIESWSSSETGF
ncbi:transcription factor SCREAM2-like isoform X2 [Tripterygium wilfordii]|uniref:transcription factor SCREAM2-like isoform X2 n=1 Tax=Tripterygium wilfordii TaxID=458696 RepID=UPI0018F81073|nr:transcription factor SCREAM2-like isoform X2 [Tripterygium wilfordii]